MTLTEIKYVGTPGFDKGYTATICQIHNYRETATYVYQLEEIECPTCVALGERDRQEREDRAEMAARRGHPSICLCHSCAPHEDEYDRMNAEEAARLRVAELTSPNYCNRNPIWDADPPF